MMKTRAVRLYGASDLRLEEFQLPEIKDDEILVRVMTDSICMSTYKLLQQGKEHKRAPKNIETNPIIIGHEFSGDIVKVGEKWQDQFEPGQKFAIQPALNYKGSLDSPGYSYEFCGGAATYCIIPQEVMELGCLFVYDGEGYFGASLGEPMSCVIGAYNANYHTNKRNYIHDMGVKKDGDVLILGGGGPMGLGAVEYALAMEDKPKRVVVTDVSDGRIKRAQKLYNQEYTGKLGVEVIFVNPNKLDNQYDYLLNLTEGKGYDDVFVYVPIVELAELGDKLMAFDGCMNFFAGPNESDFTAGINLYNVHYTATKIIGTTGGNTDDLKEALELSAKGKIRPQVMVTHVGGIDAVIDATANLPNIPGGKKLIYNHIEMPLTAIEDFAKLGEENALFKELDIKCKEHGGLWNAEAEKILLDHFGV